MTPRPDSRDVARALRSLKRRRIRRRLLLAMAALALIAAALLATVFRPMTHTGRAMLPTVKDGQMIFVNTLDRTPERQQMALLRSAAPEGGAMLRRVAALPGDKVSIAAEGTLLLNGEPLVTIPAGNRDIPNALLIPDGMLFVLGDNLAEALDSRMAAVGLIPAEDVIGVVW